METGSALLLPPGLYRDIASGFLVDNQDRNFAKGCKIIKLLGVVLFHKEQLIHSERLYMQQQKLPSKESAKRNPTWTYCDECFLPSREIFSGHRRDEKTGRQVGLGPVWELVFCLAWMVLSLVSLFHKINWVNACWGLVSNQDNAFNLKECIVQTRFCSVAFAHTVKGNLKNFTVKIPKINIQLKITKTTFCCNYTNVTHIHECARK